MKKLVMYGLMVALFMSSGGIQAGASGRGGGAAGKGGAAGGRGKAASAGLFSPQELTPQRLAGAARLGLLAHYCQEKANFELGRELSEEWAAQDDDERIKFVQGQTWNQFLEANIERLEAKLRQQNVEAAKNKDDLDEQRAGFQALFPLADFIAGLKPAELNQLADVGVALCIATTAGEVVGASSETVREVYGQQVFEENRAALPGLLIAAEQALVTHKALIKRWDAAAPKSSDPDGLNLQSAKIVEELNEIRAKLPAASPAAGRRPTVPSADVRQPADVAHLRARLEQLQQSFADLQRTVQGGAVRHRHRQEVDEYVLTLADLDPEERAYVGELPPDDADDRTKRAWQVRWNYVRNTRAVETAPLADQAARRSYRNHVRGIQD